MTTRRWTTVLSLALTAVLVAVGSPASAATKTFKDKKGDAPSDVDIRKVKVVHGKKAVRVVLRVDDLKYGVYDDLYETTINIDTKKSRRGPEYMVGTGGFHAYYAKVKGWKSINDPDDPYGDITCGWKLSYRPSADLVTYKVPRSCLSNPRRVRVNVVVRGYDANGYVSGSDKSPAYRKFHGWVRRG